MITFFEIQARVLERHDGVRIRDEVRLATANTLEGAARAAHTFAAVGFTVWIFAVDRSTSRRRSYRLVERLDQRLIQMRLRSYAAAVGYGMPVVEWHR
jgi:hypothetical protein